MRKRRANRNAVQSDGGKRSTTLQRSAFTETDFVADTLPRWRLNRRLATSTGRAPFRPAVRSNLEDAMSFRKNPARDARTPHNQVSDLAYRLWEARSRPFGSPDADWHLAERLVNDYRLESPFDEFLRKATAVLNGPSIAQGLRDDAEYARVIEERRYVIDVLDRVEMLAYAHSRLNALSGLYRDAEAQMDGTKRESREEPLTWEVPDEIVWQWDCRALEGRVLVAFVYYEMTSLAHMLRALRVSIPKGELEYLVKARDKFMAHPVFGSRVRNAHSAMSIPRVGLLHAHAIYGDEVDPALIDHYNGPFAPKNAADRARLRDENERLILSSKRHCDFLADERSRLKAFGIREPNLEGSLNEMAKLLLSSAFPEIERIAAQPIPSRR